MDPFPRREVEALWSDFCVVDCYGESFALAEDAKDDEVADGPRHTQTRHVRVPVNHCIGSRSPTLKCMDDRCAGGGLDCNHAGPGGPDPTDGFELGKCLPHADQPGPAPSRIENNIR